MKNVNFIANKSTLLLCLNALDLDINPIIDNINLYASSYIYEKTINPPKIYSENQQKGLKTLLF
jgi:hypothetical protein